MRRFWLIFLLLAAVAVAFGQVEVSDINGIPRPVSPGWKMPTATVLQRGLILATSTVMTPNIVSTFSAILANQTPFFLLEVIPASGVINVGLPGDATATIGSLSYITNAAPLRVWVATTTPLFGFIASNTNTLVYVNILK
jgi:hypothetical protein